MIAALEAARPFVVGLLLLHVGFVAGMWLSRSLLRNSRWMDANAFEADNPNRRRNETCRRIRVELS